MIVAIIPARGGSKGIPGKNTKIIAGKPLIAWTIDAAKKSKLIDRVYVSTDDNKIAEIALKYGAEVLKRPVELASDTASTISVLSHHANKELLDADVIVLLQCTSPIRKDGLIDECIFNFNKKNSDSLATGYLCKNEEWGSSNAPRQEVKGFFYDDGNVYIVRAELIRKGDFFGTHRIPFNLDDKAQNHEIDDLFDFKVAEFLLKELNAPRPITIANKRVGSMNPCLIIAEAGVNHNGNLDLAKKLIDIAKESGADIVKFQTWVTEELLTKTSSQAEYQRKNTGIVESQFDMIKRLELNQLQFKELKEYCDKKDIVFMSTPDDEKSAKFLFELGVPAFKIGSGEVTNLLFLETIAKLNKPIILSTGMSTMEEIREAVRVITQHNKDLVLLHCTSNYPVSLDTVNLSAMCTLENEFCLNVGYSDHTEGILVPVLARAMGARIIEKHFTFDKTADGPDHKASLNPSELKEMIQQIRKCELILGRAEKKPVSCEEEIKKVVRKKIVAKCRISKGERISLDLLAFKRTDNKGYSANEYGVVLKRKANRDIEKDEAIGEENTVEL